MLNRFAEVAVIKEDIIVFPPIYAILNCKDAIVLMAKLLLAAWRWGLQNKDSISLLPDRQLQKYLQPYCNAAKRGTGNNPATECEAHIHKREHSSIEHISFWLKFDVV